MFPYKMKYFNGQKIADLFTHLVKKLDITEVYEGYKIFVLATLQICL